MRKCDCGNPLEPGDNKCDWCFIYDDRLAEYDDLPADRKHHYAETRITGNRVCVKCGQFPDTDGPLPCNGTTD